MLCEHGGFGNVPHALRIFSERSLVADEPNQNLMPVMAMDTSYNYFLVVLSILLAMFASYAALDLAGRVTSAHGRARAVWLSFGSAAMGLGIWSMHYIGMLALSMNVPVSYHVATVVLSLLAAVAASAIALFVVSRARMTLWQQAAGSLSMGTGIAAMHYIGMAAMRCACVVIYDPGIVAASIVLAVVIAGVALRLAFRVREEKAASWKKIASALVMGSAIPLMHYTGMWAATFQASSAAPNLNGSVGISTIGIVAISVSSIFVLGGAITSSFVDRFIALQRDELSSALERENYFKTMSEALPEMIWTSDPTGLVTYSNQKMLDYFGLAFTQMQGGKWAESIHPDEMKDCLKKWNGALLTGNQYEMEYRLRGPSGTYRWFVARANPIRDGAGKIVKWFGTITDIESQKNSQQTLEGQIKERTVQLADANSRLQEEMFERDSARKALDQQNAKMMSQLEERSKRATLLAKMGEHLQSCISRDEVFSAARGFAPKIFPTTRGAIVLLNSARTHAEVIGSWSDCELPATEFEPHKCWALRTAQPHLVLPGDPTAPCAHALGVKHTYLCVPILAQGETLGMLHLQATDEVPQLNPAELSFNTTFAGQVGLSIANIKLREALRTQSVRDALTGLYNRRYLEEVLDRETRRAGRAGQSLVVMMADLDHFKQFNDTYGHDAGDTVLREAAAFLVKNVRAEDFVCRYGGEEFVIVLPAADLAGAQARAERIRSKMKEQVIVYQGQTLRMVTFSMGIAEFSVHGNTPQELMAAADAALYEAKRAGRDQVVVAREMEAQPVGIVETPQAQRSNSTTA